jgi:DNA-binding MarR family transcriptional regulator
MKGLYSVISSRVPQNILNHEDHITLDLLDVVEHNSTITQRILATELGVALGLTNSYLKRCTKKGLIKVQQIPSNRYSYYLTPRGFAEKSRLTAEYLKQSFNFFRRAKSQSSELLKLCRDRRWARVALAGKSNLTEITILSAVELNIELVGIIDEVAADTTSTYMKLRVVSRLSELGTLNALILTNMENLQETFDEAIQFFPRDRVLTIPLLGVNRDRTEQLFIAASDLGGGK